MLTSTKIQGRRKERGNGSENGSVFPIRVMEEWCGPLRLVSISKGLDGVVEEEEDVESKESESSEREYDMVPPLFSPEKMTEPMSPVEEDGETGAFNDVVGSGYNDKHGGGEKPLIMAVNEVEFEKEIGVSENWQVTRFNNDMVGSQAHAEVDMGVEVFGGCSSNQRVEESNLNLINSQLGSGVSLSVGLEIGSMGDVPNATIPIPCSIEDALEKKRKRKMKLKSSIPMKMMILNNSIKKSRSKSSSSSSSRGSSIAAGVTRNGVGEFLPSSSNSIQSAGMSNQGTRGGSIGDSEIRRGNERAWVDHQNDIASKTWEFAKSQLGVVGLENDSVYIEEIRKMDERDQEAQRLREAKSSDQ